MFTHPWLLRPLALLFFLGAGLWPLLVLDAWRLGRPALPAAPARRRIGGADRRAVLATSPCRWPPAGGRGPRGSSGGVFGSGPASAAVDGRYNVLLLGGDAGPDRIGLRPDSITLASIDAASGRTVLFSLPRNLENVPFPAGSAAARALPHGWSCGDVCLLNAVYTWGSQHRGLFPDAADPGAEAMKQAVSGVTGLHGQLLRARSTSPASAALIDAMGGIELTVGSRVPIGGGTSRVSGYISPGSQHLDGYHALWYARSPARLQRLRADGAAALRDDRDGEPVRPGDRAGPVPGHRSGRARTW